MKMETPVTAPFAGGWSPSTSWPTPRSSAARRWCGSGRNRRPTLRVSDAPPTSTCRASRPSTPRGKPCERVYGPLGDYLLGYDRVAGGAARLLTEQRRLAEVAPPADRRCSPARTGCSTCTPISARCTARGPRRSRRLIAVRRTPRSTCRPSCSGSTPTVPVCPTIPPAPGRALARYGVRSLERTPELEAAVMWLFRSFARLAELHGVVIAILQRRLEHRARCVVGPAEARPARPAGRATQGRQQAVADLARDMLFHFFDEPSMEAAASEASPRWAPTSRTSSPSRTAPTAPSASTGWSGVRSHCAR